MKTETKEDTFTAEYTDLFGGEANYSWVRRATIPATESRRALMRRAKAALGLSGVRGCVREYGEMLEFRPYRSCTVMFITFDY